MGGLRGAPALETTWMLMLVVVVVSMNCVDAESKSLVLLVLQLLWVIRVDDKEASLKKPKKL